MSNDLSPDEHAEMRQVLFDGADRVGRGHVRLARIIGAGGVAVLVVGVALTVGLNLGRGMTDPAASPSPSATSTVPAACARYAGSQTQLPVVSGGQAIVRAVARATLPAGVIVSPGTTVQASTPADGSGRFDVVVRVCSVPLTRAELIAVGGLIAEAISADASRATVATLSVESWVPIGSDAIGADVNQPSIATQFPRHTWSAESPSPPDAWR